MLGEWGLRHFIINYRTSLRVYLDNNGKRYKMPKIITFSALRPSHQKSNHISILFVTLPSNKRLQSRNQQPAIALVLKLNSIMSQYSLFGAALSRIDRIFAAIEGLEPYVAKTVVLGKLRTNCSGSFLLYHHLCLILLTKLWFNWNAIL
jgi:hypothetical protein